GFKIVTKNIKTIKSRGTKKGKANFDVEITFDAAVRIGEYSKIILFSGDSDFAYLLFNLKKKGIVTSVVSTKWRTAKELMRVADLFAELKKCDFVKKRAPLRGRSRRSSDRKRRIAKRR
ncbi:MAG: NYN domain-containing protein, partial [Patescibacteria group bacterium]